MMVTRCSVLVGQYFIEADDSERPFDRSHRSIAYQRAKDVRDTLPFGTRRDVYEVRRPLHSLS